MLLTPTSMSKFLLDHSDLSLNYAELCPIFSLPPLTSYLLTSSYYPYHSLYSAFMTNANNYSYLNLDNTQLTYN